MSFKPRLRPIDFQPVTYQDQQMWLLRDPLELTDQQLIVPAPLAQMFLFCDGARNVEEIQAAVSQLLGVPLADGIIENALASLDEAYLLDNERSQQAIQAQLAAYRELDHRPPALAGLGYPADPAELARTFDEFGEGDDLDGWHPWTGRGVVSPHIDFHRGGPVYARVWRRAEAAVKQADLVLIFGTDHNGATGSVTLTEKAYATPFGVLPTDLELVGKLAEAIGPGAFAQELNHRTEHSVELSAVWMHHIRGANPCPMVPVLCGSFQHFVSNGHHPAEDARLNAFLETLREETAGKRVLAVASVDLAHVGPSFGDGFSMDAERRADLSISDLSLIEAISLGDEARFYQEVAQIEDRNRICGFSSIYLMLRYLGQTSGAKLAYEHCPADQADASLVSICGMLLT